MKFALLFISMFLFAECYAQSKLIYSVEPNWDNNISEIIKTQNIKTDSVYYYEKRKNNKDRTLILTQYFDSLGNLIERDEYNFKGEVFRITNYTYLDTVLVRKETISKTMLYLKNSNISKKVNTYDRDSVGNIIEEKEYSFYGDSLKSHSPRILKREYDDSGHLVKEFVTPPGDKTYLRHTYIYANGILTEIKSYDVNQNWMYSYLYEYDEKKMSKSVYLFNNSKNLSHEFFYNDQKRLIKEISYEEGQAIQDHTTQTYSYKHDGLLESQTFEGLKGENYYYKHFYSK